MKYWQTTTILFLLGLSRSTPSLGGWQTFTAADGLAADFVPGITRDDEGAFWFGTTSGVSRFDGVGWRTYTKRDGLIDNYVYTIARDRAQNLWIGTDYGVSCFDGTRWRSYTQIDGLAGDHARVLLGDRQGNVWFGTNRGLCRFDGSNWRTFGPTDGLDQRYINAIAEDHSSNLWFGGELGVTRYDGTNWKTFTPADGLVSGDVRSIGEDELGNLWFGTSGGLSSFDGTSWMTYPPKPGGLANQQVITMLADSFGGMWFGTPRGVSRHCGGKWRTYTKADGLGGNWVMSMFQDRLGNVWFGTLGGGVSRYDQVSSRSYTEADGLAGNVVYAILKDRSGDLWFGGWGGASRYDGASWTIYNEFNGLGSEVEAIFEDTAGNLWFALPGFVRRYDGTDWNYYAPPGGLPGDYVRSVCVDRAGNLWIGTDTHGVYCYDGMTWQAYAHEVGPWVRAIREDSTGGLWFGWSGGVVRFDSAGWTRIEDGGLPDKQVRAILEDSRGDLWFATDQGVIQREGGGWRSYTVADGLAGDDVYSLAEDRLGNVWAGTTAGVGRYNGESWGTYGVGDGLTGRHVYAISEDALGQIWFGTYGQGITCHEPDRIAPEAIFIPLPPPLSSNASRTITYGAAFGETRGISFSYSFDDAPWSAWSEISYWRGEAIGDGLHTFKIKARDRMGNMDSTEALCSFDIDATPPLPVIISPASGQAVRESLVVRGTANDQRFARYRLELRRQTATAWEFLAESAVPVVNGTLARLGLEPSLMPDGDCDLRLTVSDTLGLTGTALVSFVVDNQAPYADVTAPAKVRAAVGGDIYTTGSELHLYFPPRALREDALVRIVPTQADSVPQTLPSGALRVLPGYDIAWGGVVLGKEATLELSLGELDITSIQGSLAIYTFSDGPTWRRLGGTTDAGVRRISLAISEPGRYALFADQGAGSGERALSSLSLTPRVFSPTGGSCNEEVAISFSLGRAGPATVKVFNRAGRLMREVLSSKWLNAGANLVRWDGRDGDTRLVEDDVFLVVVEAAGRKQVKTVAVVR